MEEINELAKQLATDYKNKLADSVATGNLSQFTYEVKVNEYSYTIVFNLADYWQYVEDGRKIGKYPPIEAIKKWISVKPILPKPFNGKLPTNNQLAFLISRKIAKKGIKPKNYLKKTLLENKSIIENTVANLGAEIINQFFKEMNDEIQ